MKKSQIITRFLLLTLFFTPTGCQQPNSPPEIPFTTDISVDMLSIYTSYVPVKIDIMPLTEFISTADFKNINVYVSLLDPFGCQIKSPAMFRFELYKYEKPPARPKGKRAKIWQDKDLNDPITNNNYWREFLRTYEFDLPCEEIIGEDYILQVTCLCPNGKRLTSEFSFVKPQ